MSDAQDKRDEAIAWHVRLNAGDADASTWERFSAWLEADDANRAAFNRVEELDDSLAELAPLMAGRADEEFARFQRSPIASTGSPRTAFVAGAFLAVIVAVGVLFLARDRQPGETEYATHIGEMKSIRLGDGSAIDLDSNTRLAVSGGGRHAVLRQGEALFHVVPDAAHPFVVTAGDRDVRDVGTVFDIQHYDGAVTITVAEGEVAVRQHLGSGAEVRLHAGARLASRDGEKDVLTAHVDPARALAWRDGYLVYDDAPLSDVVRDLNRRYPSQVALADPAMAALRFSGVLKMDREDAVLERLSRFLPVRVTRPGSGGFVLRAKPKGD